MKVLLNLLRFLTRLFNACDVSEGNSGRSSDCIHARNEFFPFSSFSLQRLKSSELAVVSKMPIIEASIAHATPLSSALIPNAAFSEATFMTPPELPIKVRIASDFNKSVRPIITPAIVPARPQYKGIGVCVAMSFSTESQWRSTASLSKPKSITDPELFPRYLFIEFLIDSKIVFPAPYTPSTRFVCSLRRRRHDDSSEKILLN